MEFIKWGQKQVRQFALNLTETEIRVEEATNNDPWGPHGTVMSEIAEEAIDPERYKEIMSVVARRLTDTAENWRHVYKALLLLEHMIRHGPSKVARDTQANIEVLRDLQRFEFKDKNGRDQGSNVRNRAKEIVALVENAEKLAEARETARTNRNKYTGTSKESARFRTDASRTVTYKQTVPQRVAYEPKSSEKDMVVDEDPFEATRKRIEKLKAGDKQATSSSIKVTLPQQHKKEPKKLSQVKMNPQIAATFMKQQPQVQNTSATTTTPAIQQSVLRPDDLLGDLVDDVSSQHTETVKPSETSQSNMDDMFDALTSSTTQLQETKAVDSSDWADFTGGTVAQNLQEMSQISPAPTEVRQEISLPALLDGGMRVPDMSTPISTAPTAPSPNTTDPFASLCVTSQKPARVPMGAGKTASTISFPSQQQTIPATAPMAFTVNSSPTDANITWTSTVLPPQSTQAPVHQSNNLNYGISSVSTNWARPQGTPMNPAAVQTQRVTVRKQDPFANLGF